MKEKAFKLHRSFYLRPAEDSAKDFLGKYLVHNSPDGTLVGLITEVEAYPAYTDEVSHGNKRTSRTEVMYGEGGYAYVYLIYGIHHQFAVVVNKINVPEVIFIRALKPVAGINIMRRNFSRDVKKLSDLTKSPGNLCKSFNINLELYGEDLTGDRLYIEDRGMRVNPSYIKAASRVGINKRLDGHDNKLRYYFSAYAEDPTTERSEEVGINAKRF